jgi:hypothetical protein
MNNHKNSQKGFTILVAVVTAGILLIVAMTIGGIALKEQVLSTANKESQVAFYAADTGMECALYWDQKRGAFTNDSVNDPAGAAALAVFNCNGLGNFTSPVLTPGTPSTQFSYKFMVSGIPVGTGSDTTCAVVKIEKDIAYTVPSGGTSIKTDIYSYGYNTCEASLSRLERGIEGHFGGDN